MEQDSVDMRPFGRTLVNDRGGSAQHAPVRKLMADLGSGRDTMGRLRQSLCRST
jgi:hypothetical protein